MEKEFLDENFNDFFEVNKKRFESKLLDQAVNVRDKINDILRVGDIDLINNAHRLIYYVIDGEKQDELQAFAKQEGIAWATHSLTLYFKLEWVQAIRRTLWSFIQEYTKATQKLTIDTIFDLEKLLNNRIDHFLNVFFIINIAIN
ncbi:hypothetical protein [Psychrobacillus sp. L4]|uniref:hypothetical protein n=1 Tax=Psychrobacillus sp. L4 TaxID=3236892 RepID=UPI0036F19F97